MFLTHLHDDMKNHIQFQLQMNLLIISEKEGTGVDCERADTEREEFPRDGFHLRQLVGGKFY